MNRKELLLAIWHSQDEAFNLMMEYDLLPHYYGDFVLFQAEAYIISEAGKKPGITITELSEILKKTTSACSQMTKKLIAKGLLVQSRNTENRRIYNIYLTEMGSKLHKDHIEFNESCQKNTFNMLEEFSDEELKTFIKVQNVINNSYVGDIQRSKEKYHKNNLQNDVIGVI